MDAKTPTSIKGIQRFLGWFTALSRFISRYEDKCRLFFNLLIKEEAKPGRIGVKKGEKKRKEEKPAERAKFKWNLEYQNAWEEIKDYLVRMPTLKQLTNDKLFIIYLAVGEKSISSVLVQEDDQG